MTAPEKSDTETLQRRIVYYAAERALMTWMSTALGVMALGFVIDRFGLFLTLFAAQVDRPATAPAFYFWTGTIMVSLGCLMMLVATVRFWRFSIAYARERGTNPRRGILVGVVFSAILTVIGAAIVFFLVYEPG